MTIRVALAEGNGIGPEITQAVVTIFEAAQVPVQFHKVEMGLDVFQRGVSSGMTPETKATIEELGVLFKGPMETPRGN